MAETLAEAKSAFEAEGLFVSTSDSRGLWIAGSVVAVAEGTRLSHDACVLRTDAGRWVAVFPADGLQTYEVPGSLSELAALIVSVYRTHRRDKGDFRDALRRQVTNPEQYLVGRSLAGV